MRPFLILPLFLLVGCASAPHVAPRFDKPSTVPIRQAQRAASDHVAKAKDITRTLTIRVPEDQVKVDALTKELDETQAALQQVEGARAALDTQLEAQTNRANQLATDYDKSSAQITSLHESRHHWVKLFWYAFGALTLALVWIFKKPLMMFAGGIGI